MLELEQKGRKVENKCELCGDNSNLKTYEISNYKANLCKICLLNFNKPEQININHWRCLNDSIWSDNLAIKILSYQILSHIKNESWANDLLDMMYIEDDLKALANINNIQKHKSFDSNGVKLFSGDNVSIIKDLDIKGTSFKAKRGTIVKSIILTDNPEQIEGRVNGVKVILLTKFLKKV